jgi:demethylmenaquinone methyltransferase / 2-methoxy-6-polyprenyl-1,4-benzoquinol methylase
MTAQQAGRAHYTGDKAQYVREMFSGIADRYDLLNDVLSFHRHKAWRRFAVRVSGVGPGEAALDVCTGTGDFAVELFRVVGPQGLVVGSDFCEPMVRLGKTKSERSADGRIPMMIADAQALPYPSDRFDCVTVGFGIRNVADTQLAFDEMARVARPGGKVVCLEFNQPPSRFWRRIVSFYNGAILPRIGGLLSRREAYTYLPASIEAFHSREALTAMMEAAGLRDVRVYDLNFGSVCIHVGTKQRSEARKKEEVR